MTTGRAAADTRSTAASLEELARRVRSDGEEALLRRVVSRSVAVCSGKGGVGKTITACNLALSYARKGLRVGLVDLDPLSDVASLLDLQDSEGALNKSGDFRGDGGARGAADDGLADIAQPVFRRLEVLFPSQKLTAAELNAMVDSLYGPRLPLIDSHYDILIFDMPAGMAYEDNLAWIPLMRSLVLVTNPEPTAHASAGAYAKEVQRLYPGTVIRLWHNRYSGRAREGFHPRDVAGNYNRYVDPTDRLTEAEQALLVDFAFVPEDPALDLLQGEPLPALHVLKCIRDGLDYAHGRLLAHAIRPIGLPPAVREIVTSYVHRNPRIGGADAYIAGLARYVETVASVPGEASRTAGKAAGSDTSRAAGRADAPKGAGAGAAATFSAPLTTALREFLLRVRKSGLRREMLRVHGLVADQIKRLEESRGPFAGRAAPERDAAFDKELGRLLVILNKAARGSALMRNQGVLLLFYFSLHKLFQSRTLMSVIRALIPRRAGQKGRMVRDRYSQIRSLVEGDPAYRKRYLGTLQTLHGLVTRQLAAVGKALDLGTLVVQDGAGKIDGKPYLKLLAVFLHETLYSGLSVIIGFDYRSAAGAFQDGADRLLASLSGRP